MGYQVLSRCGVCGLVVFAPSEISGSLVPNSSNAKVKLSWQQGARVQQRGRTGWFWWFWCPASWGYELLVFLFRRYHKIWKRQIKSLLLWWTRPKDLQNGPCWVAEDQQRGNMGSSTNQPDYNEPCDITGIGRATITKYPIQTFRWVKRFTPDAFLLVRFAIPQAWQEVFQPLRSTMFWANSSNLTSTMNDGCSTGNHPNSKVYFW